MSLDVTGVSPPVPALPHVINRRPGSAGGHGPSTTGDLQPGVPSHTGGRETETGGLAKRTFCVVLTRRRLTPRVPLSPHYLSPSSSPLVCSSPSRVCPPRTLQSRTVHRPRSRCRQQECQLEFVTSSAITERSMRPLIQMLLDGIGRIGI